MPSTTWIFSWHALRVRAIADSGMELLRQASKGLNHLPDEIVQQAIAELQ